MSKTIIISEYYLSFLFKFTWNIFNLLFIDKNKLERKKKNVKRAT